MPQNIVITGGGAAGYFLAANIPKNDKYKVTILEKSSKPLQKVKVSGGGRCNLTHAEFDPKELVKNYPRGRKELLSVFHKFQPGDTFAWFQERNLDLITEEDLRVFPITNNSESIIEIFENETSKNEVEVIFNQGVQRVEKVGNQYQIHTQSEIYDADKLVICSGSSNAIWKVIENDLGHKIIEPVPSLFTFNCTHPLIVDLPGTSFSEAEIEIPDLKLAETGPLLITHWGLSGPAILKLSAFGARELADLDYQFEIKVNFVNQSLEECLNELKEFKHTNPSFKIIQNQLFPMISKRFWNRVLEVNYINPQLNWAEISNEDIKNIAQSLCETKIRVEGKSTNKDEFVTAGGVDLKEIDMKTMQSKLHENLFFAGEVLNIDGITGGFNFQACWSEAFIISDYFKNTFQ